MPWPNARLTNYAPGAQIRSADLNLFQDAIIGGQHGAKPLILHPADGRSVLGAALSYNGGFVSASGSGAWEQSVPLHAGDVVRSIVWSYNRANGTQAFRLKRIDLSSGGIFDVSVRTVAAGTGVAQTVVLNINHAVSPGSTYYAQWTSGASGDAYYGAVITYDHP